MSLLSKGTKSSHIKTRNNHRYDPNHWIVICDRCGVRRDSSEMRKEWQGFLVCLTCYEDRHPLLDEGKYQRPETKIPNPTRPESSSIFISSCTQLGSQGIIGYGIIGCMVIGRYDGEAMINVYLAAEQA